MRATLILLTSLFLCYSCEKELDITLSPKEKRIVVNSFFNDEEYLHVNISSTQPSTDGDTVYFIDNACVLLYEDDIFLDTLTLRTDGNYFSDKVIPEAGVSYKLTVEVPGMTTATTDYSQIPAAVKEFLLDTAFYSLDNSITNSRQVSLKFKDLENTPNYYLLYMIWEGTRYEFDADSNIVDSLKIKVTHGRGEGISMPGYYPGKLFFSDELIEGDTIKKNLFFRKDMIDSGIREFDKFVAYFRLCTISEEYYLYGKSYIEQHNSIDYSMFVEPVTVYSNINNGDGIFAGYGQCIDSVYYSD